MNLFKDKFKEMEQNNDVEGLVQLLDDNRWQNRYKAIISLLSIGDKSAIEDVKKALDDKNPIVREAAIYYLRSNDAFPKNKLEDMQLYPFDIKNPYNKIKKISVSSDKSIDSETDAIENVNEKLKEKAANLGANALINVKYDKGIFTLFKGAKGHGMAVVIDDTEEVKPLLKGALISGLFIMLYGILRYLDYRLDAHIADLYLANLFVLWGIFIFFAEIFIRKGYKNKTYFLVFLGILAASMLVGLDYFIKNRLNNLYSYFILFLLTMLVIIFIYEYNKRKNDPKMPWKDEWGF